MLRFNSNFRFKDLKLITITHFRYTAEETNYEVMWMFCPHPFTPHTWWTFALVMERRAFMYTRTGLSDNSSFTSAFVVTTLMQGPDSMSCSSSMSSLQSSSSYSLDRRP